MPQSEPEPPEAIDRLIHEPARLSIMKSLFVVESADATWLLQQTGLTWGNLSSHLAKLEANGYVDVVKAFKSRKPRTTIALTEAGREALLAYRRRILDELGGIG